jgi:hypothetical protein
MIWVQLFLTCLLLYVVFSKVISLCPKKLPSLWYAIPLLLGWVGSVIGMVVAVLGFIWGTLPGLLW